MSDPYRDAAHPHCPRCSEVLLAVGTSYVCPRDCGEWITLTSLREQVVIPELGTDYAAFPIGTVNCPICARRMESRAWSNALFELCVAHGVWIDARFRKDFHRYIAALIADERVIAEFAERIGSATLDARRELARRIFALERRMLALEQRTHDGLAVDPDSDDDDDRDND